MQTIFLSYARADGQIAATRLRSELERAGFQVWRDIEDMQGGQAWKDQLRQAIRTVDTVVVLLTPAAVASKYVEWEWESALTLEKRVIPLLISTCDVPDELGRLHYHNLSSEQDYILSFAALLRDLYSVSAVEQDSAANKQTPQVDSAVERGISIGGNADNSNLVTGDSNVVNSNNSSTHQSGKYNIKIDKADNMRIGDDYNS
ncbi:MAG: toll/interleukin-1 receptor domain-containing protein [Cyanobacteria bacterium J06636_16]